ncbi:MAG: FAD-dependent oxidoreductase [Oleiphilaceae bacterium]|nr:FAD-dependent oxidoreductase [Oleiphilaceae bacterium]
MDSTDRQHLVVIGHGMAAQRLLQSLTERGDCPWRITVIGEEPQPAYNRILLSHWLAGEADDKALALCRGDWFSRQGIRRHSGDPVTTIDRNHRQVITAAGERFGYDRLVISTGSRPTPLGIPGESLAGVQGFRTLADTRALRNQARQGGSAVVIGGGFLGLEAAEGLRKQGMSVTLLHRSSHLLNRQLDPVAGTLLADTLCDRGLTLRLNTRVAACLGDQQVQGVRLACGDTLKADRVVIATGITPNRELAQDAGLECGRGIAVDDTLTSSDPRIHALGECCELDGQTFGLVDPVHQQAQVLAARLLGQPVTYSPDLSATRLKISGIDLFSCGQVVPDQGTESIIYHDRLHGEYRHLLLRDNRLVGAVLYGDARSGPWLLGHLQAGTDLSPRREALAFGEAHCGDESEAQAA